MSENWASTCGRSNSSGEAAAMRYIVYKQPLSLDRFFIHDVSMSEGSTCRMEASFVIVSLNRFQQIVAVHTFQAANDQLKVCYLKTDHSFEKNHHKNGMDDDHFFSFTTLIYSKII